MEGKKFFYTNLHVQWSTSTYNWVIVIYLLFWNHFEATYIYIYLYRFKTCDFHWTLDQLFQWFCGPLLWLDSQTNSFSTKNIYIGFHRFHKIWQILEIYVYQPWSTQPLISFWRTSVTCLWWKIPSRSIASIINWTRNIHWLIYSTPSQTNGWNRPHKIWRLARMTFLFYFLVGGFIPVQKYFGQIGMNLPKYKVNMKNRWNHHLVSGCLFILFTPLKTNMTMEKTPSLVGDTSSKGCFLSIVILVFGTGGSKHLFFGVTSPWPVVPWTRPGQALQIVSSLPTKLMGAKKKILCEPLERP